MIVLWISIFCTLCVCACLFFLRIRRQFPISGWFDCDGLRKLIRLARDHRPLVPRERVQNSVDDWGIIARHATSLQKISNMHYNDVILGAIASQVTSLTIVYSTVYSDADQRKHQSSASLAFVRGIHRRPVNSPHKWPVTWKMFPFDDVIMDFEMAVSDMSFF